MTEVVGIKFKNRGKVYSFDPAGIQVQTGDQVVVETSKGLELGECARGNYEVPDEQIVPPLRCVVRIATEEDLRTVQANKDREAEALAICRERIAEHGLNMKLVDVEYNFEGNKILFFFTSDGRVDFRELVKDLAGIFRMRIELRQIGVRDEAKMLGGIGICGRPYCCSQFLDDFQPVSTKMAKTQSMSLNPTKISGSCGRLMCCLRYEQAAYVDLLKQVPKTGAYVETPDGYGTVTQVNLLRKKAKVKIDGSTDAQQARNYDAEDVAVVPGGRPKPGETPPSILKPRIKPEPEPEQEDEVYGNGWLLEGTPIFGEKLREKKTVASDEQQEKADRKKRHNRRRGRGKAANSGKKENQTEEKQTQNKPPVQKNQQNAQQSGGQPRKKPNRKPNQKPDAEGGRPRSNGEGSKPKSPVPQNAHEGAAQGGSAVHKNYHRRRSSKPKPKTGGNPQQ